MQEYKAGVQEYKITKSVAWMTNDNITEGTTAWMSVWNILLLPECSYSLFITGYAYVKQFSVSSFSTLWWI